MKKLNKDNNVSISKDNSIKAQEKIIKPESHKSNKKEELDRIIQRNLFKEFSNNEIEEMGLDNFNLNLKKKKKKESNGSNYWRNRNDVNYRKIMFRYN